VKKASLAILLFMSGVTVVFAAGSPGSPGAPCPSTGDSTQIFGKTVLSCVDGKWKLDGHAPASVIFTVQMLSGQKHLLDASVVTLDGRSVPVRDGHERSYISGITKDGGKVTKIPGVVDYGFAMTITPTLMKDGKIQVKFEAENSDLVSIDTIKQGDMEVEVPKVNTISFMQVVTLENGKAVTIPFGQYTLKLKATRG